MQLGGNCPASCLLGAAIALGLTPALADTAPAQGSISFKQLDYSDSQPGLDRMQVRSSAIGIVAPVGDQWAVEGTWVVDSISGASPAYHNAVKSAKPVTDTRKGADVRLSHYLPAATVSLGLSTSDEADYFSRAMSLQLSHSSDDRNTTVTLGVAYTDDDINPVNKVVKAAKKQTHELLLGITQVLTPQDIVQLNITDATGQGYFTDPYKLLDNRPTARRHQTALARWNHHYTALEATQKLSFRYYKDSFGIESTQLSLEWAQALPQGWTVTPLLRLYSQSAAYFYVPPDQALPGAIAIPQDYLPGQTMLSFDPRLASFTASTYGLKVAKRLDKDWSADLRVEQYRQSSDATPLDARFIQLGLTRIF